MLDLAALRVLELWIGDILDLDLARPGVYAAAIPAHDKPLLNCGQMADSHSGVVPSYARMTQVSCDAG